MSKKTEFTYDYYSDTSPIGDKNFRIHYKDIEYLPRIVYKNASRYSSLRTIQDDETKKIHHESWNQQVIDRSAEDQFFTVTNAEKDRLDIIAVKYYGTPRFWWVIAIANYLLDPFDIPVGLTLRIPPKQSLYTSGGIIHG